MKRKTLLLLVMTSFITYSYSQKKQQPTTGFAITAVEKGGKSWKEVRLVDIGTGEPIKDIYKSAQDLEALNARTGKPVVKKDNTAVNQPATRVFVERDKERLAAGEAITITRTSAPRAPKESKPAEAAAPARKKVVNLDAELDKANNVNVNTNTNVHIYTYNEAKAAHIQEKVKAEVMAKIKEHKNVVIVRSGHYVQQNTDKPFATNSAALAYDKKHERLYYTPMGINQLRYIDLKSKTPKVYYFEDEPFGTVKGSYDSPNQITRMVIASDGDGYALSNDANHLIRFTTGKKPTITDLGPLTDDPANGRYSVHSGGGYGGDMIADASGNLYLFTANRSVFMISIETKVATFKGTIKGLPKGFSTNGAMVEADSKVIVASSESTAGYFRVDLNTLQATQASESGLVFNASDLANGNLAFDKKKKKKDKEQPEETIVKEEPQPEATDEEIATKPAPTQETLSVRNGINVFPNPVVNGFFKLSFSDQPAGRYQVQVLDLAGKLISARELNINNKVQVEEFRIPELTPGGSYLVKVTSAANNISVTNKIVVQ
jgi:hypothetical protein